MSCLASVSRWIRVPAMIALAVVCPVRCEGDEQQFVTFEVHIDCWIYFRSTRDGESRVQLFEEVVERGCGFKIFRYYENQPEVLAPSGA